MQRRSLQDWASIAEIVGAAAVVVTLIYVAYELRENTRALEVASRQTLGAHDQSYFLTSIDPSIVAVALQKYRNGEDLSALERFQLQERQHLNFRIFEHARSLYRQGALNKAEWQRYETVIAINACEKEPAQEMWAYYKRSFDPDFRKVVDGMAEHCED